MGNWDKMTSWDLVLPPSRPSEHHLRWFRSHLSTLRPEDPIGVLGSTPELRDLLSELKFRDIYVLEKNQSFLEKMNELRVRESHETILLGDWLRTLRDCEQRFGAVVSDLTSGNVPYSRRKEFYFLIARSLRKAGIFCDKLLSHPIPHENLSQLLQKYEMWPVNLYTINNFNCEVFFCSELLTIYEGVQTDDFYQHIRQLSVGPNVKGILNRLPYVTPPGMSWDYGKPWHLVREDFDQSLQCTDDILEEGNSPYANRLRCIRWDKFG